MARRLAIVPDYFFVPRWLPEAAEEHSLSQPERMVFISLCFLCDRDLLTTAPVSAVAAGAGVSASTAKRALRKLADRGFIVDLGIPGPRKPRHYRVSEAKPLRYNPLAYPTRRAMRDGSGWLVSLDD